MRKILLLPFSILYAVGIAVRNFFFDQKIIKSIEFDLPVISVGNLAVGGQGKTPMVEYLLELTTDLFKRGVLSRGYKRNTKGFKMVELNSIAIDCGDEPLQMKIKFPDAMISVCEDRATGIPLMLAEDELDLILLDDAFQHRWVKPGLNILLSDFNDPFFNDSLLPSGNLRENKNAYRRADVIIFTKCNSYPDESIRQKYLKKIPGINHSKVFFTELEYGAPYQFFDDEKRKYTMADFSKAVLVCGIAQPKYLMNYLTENKIEFESFLFPDHHEFTNVDAQKIMDAYLKIVDTSGAVLFTEKDAVRFMKFNTGSILNKGVYLTIPIKMKFQPEEKIRFDKIIFDFVRTKLHIDD